MFSKEEIDDEEIKDYYWNIRLKEYEKVLFEKIKSGGEKNG